MTLFYITVFNVLFVILKSYENFKLIESSPELNPVKSSQKHFFRLLCILLQTKSSTINNEQMITKTPKKNT